MLTKKEPEPQPENGYRIIRLSRDKVTMVSDQDFLWLSRWYWKAEKSCACWYAVRTYQVNGKESTVYMHRAITDCPANMQVHHINHNSLDNRQENLQIVTKLYHKQLHNLS